MPRPVLLAEAFALPFGAAALGAGAFLAAGAGAVGWAAGLPKSVSCGMGLDHEGDGDSDGDGGDGDGGDGDGGDGDGGDRRWRSSKHARKSGGHSGNRIATWDHYQLDNRRTGRAHGWSSLQVDLLCPSPTSIQCGQMWSVCFAYASSENAPFVTRISRGMLQATKARLSLDSEH